jgi:ABC-type sugar transport system substrate-binding protein
MKTKHLFVLVLSALLLGSCQPAPIVTPNNTHPNASPPAPTALPTLTPQPMQASKTYKDMVVGFVDERHGEGWPSANRESFKATATKLGIRLKFGDITAKREPTGNQDRAMRDFIADPDVNVIVIATERSDTGWDDVLKEARAVGKLVIFEGWSTETSEDLYATYVGSDFAEEGRKAGRAMVELLKDSPKKNIVELTGTEGYSGASERAHGFHKAIEGSGVVITQSQTANWNREEGKQVMSAFLEKGKDVQGVFAQNDEMALGAIEAIKQASLKPGIDIKIVSIDGTSGALQAISAGDLNATVEWNPFIAQQVYEAALKALNGETLPKWILAKEGIFLTQLEAQNELQRRQAESTEW